MAYIKLQLFNHLVNLGGGADGAVAPYWVGLWHTFALVVLGLMWHVAPLGVGYVLIYPGAIF